MRAAGSSPAWLHPLRSPSKRAPVVPILHDRVQRDAFGSEARGRGEQLVLVLIVLLALPEAVCHEWDWNPRPPNRANLSCNQTGVAQAYMV
jgi:hypothetical protein